MGLDAYVNCGCWSRGLTTEPPVPRELIALDEDGSLRLTLPDTDANRDLRTAFDAWLDDACPHEGRVASERIGNGSARGHLAGAVEQLGRERFPLLTKLEVCDFATPADEAKAWLEELAMLRSELSQITTLALIHESTGASGHSCMATPAVFCWADFHQFGFDDESFCVWNEKHEVVFRSRRFVETPLEGNRVLLFDRSTRARYTCVRFLGSGHDRRAIHSWKVERQSTARDNLEGTLESIETVLRAAVETYGFVWWT